jgi:hypothetical protein
MTIHGEPSFVSYHVEFVERRPLRLRSLTTDACRTGEKHNLYALEARFFTHTPTMIVWRATGTSPARSRQRFRRSSRAWTFPVSRDRCGRDLSLVIGRTPANFFDPCQRGADATPCGPTSCPRRQSRAAARCFDLRATCEQRMKYVKAGALREFSLIFLIMFRPKLAQAGRIRALPQSSDRCLARQYRRCSHTVLLSRRAY